VRVILDSNLRIPVNARVITQKSPARTIVAALRGAPETKIRKLRDAGVEVLLVKSAKGRVDLRDLMKKLGRMDIMSVLIEGGAETHASAILSGIADKAVFFVAPALMTGRDSLCSVGGISPKRLSQAVRLKSVTSRFVGSDLMIEGYLG
jgi:diaminohydroxyphosphoribosylaminopyrimidine deaminase/5-amino-6-(5-phosphoribosylamino)uracil reductase